MTKNLIIMALIVLLIYLYYQQNQKYQQLHSVTSDLIFNDKVTSDSNSETTSFLRTNLNSNSLEELKTKLGGKTLNELLEENEDWETEVDTLTRTKNSLEADLLAQSNAFQTRLREKDREIKKLKEDFASEKQQHKGSLGRITKLTEQITNLEKEKRELEKKVKKMPGEFPEDDK